MQGCNQIDEHRHPGSWHVQEDDAIDLALLVIGGRHHEAQP
jgi:hypothetical protein